MEMKQAPILRKQRGGEIDTEKDISNDILPFFQRNF